MLVGAWTFVRGVSPHERDLFAFGRSTAVVRVLLDLNGHKACIE